MKISKTETKQERAARVRRIERQMARLNKRIEEREKYQRSSVHRARTYRSSKVRVLMRPPTPREMGQLGGLYLLSPAYVNRERRRSNDRSSRGKGRPRFGMPGWRKWWRLHVG